MGNNYRSLVSTANRVPRPPAHGYNNISRLFCGSQPSHVPPYPASLLYSFVFCPSFLTLCEMIDRCIGTPLDIPLSLSLSVSLSLFDPPCKILWTFWNRFSIFFFFFFFSFAKCVSPCDKVRRGRYVFDTTTRIVSVNWSC